MRSVLEIPPLEATPKLPPIDMTFLAYPEMTRGESEFKGNEHLRAPGCEYAFTTEHLEEYARVSDPDTGLLYFLRKYMKVELPDGQVVNFEPFDYQVRFADAVSRNRFVLCLLPRQAGKTATAAGMILWHLLFKRRQNIIVAANKQEQAVEIMDRLKLALEWVPKWMQQGIVQWSIKKMKFENGSRVMAAATSSSAIRGKAVSILYLDEFAHIHPNTQTKFYDSVYPAISAGQTTKLIVTTTPNGLDMFHRLWVESERNLNDFVRVSGHWSEKPGRTLEWAKGELERLGSEESFAQEYNCVTGDARITVRDKTTGEVKIVSVKELYTLLNS